ncbi:adenosylmethionine decarboxylase [Thermogladius sp. 4427co]|uniref:adenosylmethionine decarboxylase n=1 Tax=Thermogladius sp. 4427co TaxID=3450718 RepID=UPI003F7A8DA8
MAARIEVLSKKVVGKHVYGELYGCDPDLLSDPDYLANVVREAARLGRFTILDLKTWKIDPGVTVFAVVLESHISIHTWPEFSFATVDVYTCGDKADPESAFMYIVKALKAKKYTIKVASRDYEE